MKRYVTGEKVKTQIYNNNFVECEIKSINQFEHLFESNNPLSQELRYLEDELSYTTNQLIKNANHKQKVILENKISCLQKEIWSIKYKIREMVYDRYIRKGYRAADDKAEDNDTFHMKLYTSHRKVKGENTYRVCRSYIDFLNAAKKENKKLIGNGTYNSRSLITIDIDDPWPYGDVNNEGEFEKGVNEIIDKFKSYNLDIYSVVINLTKKKIGFEYKPTYHYQIQILIDEPFICLGWGNNLIFGEDDQSERVTYNLITKALNREFGGDIKYNGSWSKNPLGGKDLKAYIVGSIMNKQDLINASNPLIYKLPKTEEKKASEYISDNVLTFNTTVYDSRNQFAFNVTKSEAFRKKRELRARGLDLTLNDVIDMFKKYEYESLIFNGKSSIEEDSKIKASALGIYNFVQANYNPEFEIKVREKKVEKKNWLRRADAGNEAKIIDAGCRILKYTHLKKIGYNNKNIAQILGINPNTVTQYSKKSLSSIINILSTYLKRHKNSRVEKVIERKKRIERLLNNPYLKSFIDKDIFNDNDRLIIRDSINYTVWNNYNEINTDLIIDEIINYLEKMIINNLNGNSVIPIYNLK